MLTLTPSFQSVKDKMSVEDLSEQIGHSVEVFRSRDFWMSIAGWSNDIQHGIPKYKDTDFSSKAREDIEVMFDLACVQAVALMRIFKLDTFHGLPRQPDLSKERAFEIGKDLATKWADSHTLTEMFENNGILIVRLNLKAPGFKCLFRMMDNIPVIAINTAENSKQEFIENAAYCLGHAFFMHHELDDEASVCASFAKGFSEVFIQNNGFEIGAFDFLPRRGMQAYRLGEISSRCAAWTVGMDYVDFWTKHGWESYGLDDD